MGKLAVLLGVVVVVAAAIGVYWFFFADQDEFKSDYTLLDSDDEIKAGMTIKTKTNVLGEESELKYVVESASDGKVKYRGESNSEGQFEEQLNPKMTQHLALDSRMNLFLRLFDMNPPYLSTEMEKTNEKCCFSGFCR